MCLILAGREVRSGSRLLVLANRDEFHARPSTRAAPWAEDTSIVGGRDQVAGGSWLAVRSDGRLAAVTNLRSALPVVAPRSRGELVRNFVLGWTDASAYLAALRDTLDGYGPFNLLVADAGGVFTLDGATRRIARLAPGWSALSNGPLERSWPKMERLEALARDALARPVDDDGLLACLRDTAQPPDERLPDTGVGLAMERQLGPIFLRGERYGTRASTLVDVRSDGRITLIEAGFGPEGKPCGRMCWCSDGGPWRLV